jgi:hypothetical protein
LPFWKDPAVIKEIRLTAEQAKQIDKLWNDRLKEMLGRVEEMHKQEDEFKRLVMGRTVSPDVVALQADRVEAQRTLLYKSRAVMLYRMSLVLTADQHKGMKTIWDRMFGFTSDHANSGARGRQMFPALPSAIHAHEQGAQALDPAGKDSITTRNWATVLRFTPRPALANRSNRRP